MFLLGSYGERSIGGDAVDLKSAQGGSIPPFLDSGLFGQMLVLRMCGMKEGSHGVIQGWCV